MKARKTLPRYHGKLELHAERVAWWPDALGVEMDEWNIRVELACRAFEEQTGVEVECLGRSGRHVCVADTPANSKNYRHLKAKALKLAREFLTTDALQTEAMEPG